MEKISVIVPVYNVEKYLPACIDSILRQTHSNLEVILINDGSKDKSGQICDEFAKLDSRVKVVHKENGGVSAARNIGLDSAEGDYIAFVDSDDFIAVNMYERLLQEIKRTDTDMVLCNYSKVDEEGKILTEYAYVQNEIVTGVDALIWLEREHNWSYCVVWPRLYKKKVFDGIRFKENVICEDEFIAHQLYLNCDKVAGINESFYFYRNNPGSITSSKGIRNLDGIEAMYDRFLDYQKLGLNHLLLGTLKNAKGIMKLTREVKCSSSKDNQRINEVTFMFRYMVRQLKWKADFNSIIIAICPKFYYCIKKLFKRG